MDPEDVQCAVVAGQGEELVDDAPEGVVAKPQLDPVARLMVRLVLLLIIVLLSTTAAMLYFLSSLNKAPRTVVERDLSSWEIAVRERPDDARAWRELAYAYARAGRMDDALDTVREATTTTGKDVFTAAEADLLFASGRYAEAIAAYDRAEQDLTAVFQDSLERRERGQLKGFPNKTPLGAVHHGRGLAKRELGDIAGAISDLEKAVQALPNQAILLTDLADTYRLSGDTTRARDSYEQALRFIPDHMPALEGLRSLGGEGVE